MCGEKEEEDEPIDGKYICFVVKKEEEEEDSHGEMLGEIEEMIDRKNKPILERMNRIEAALEKIVKKIG